MSQHKNNRRRKEKREHKRRRKVNAQRKKDASRQAKKNATQAKAVSTRIAQGSGVEAKSANLGATSTPIKYFHITTCRFLECMVIAVYVGLGAFFLLTGGHEPNVVGYAYCTIGSMYAIIRLVEWIL